MNDIEIIVEENFPENLKDKFHVTHNIEDFDSERLWVKLSYTFVPKEEKKHPPVYVASMTHFANKTSSPALGDKITLKKLY